MKSTATAATTNTHYNYKQVASSGISSQPSTYQPTVPTPQELKNYINNNSVNNNRPTSSFNPQSQ